MATIEAMLEEAKAELASRQRRLREILAEVEEKEKCKREQLALTKQTETADVEKEEKCKGEQQALEKQTQTETHHVHDGDSDDDLAAWDVLDVAC